MKYPLQPSALLAVVLYLCATGALWTRCAEASRPAAAPQNGSQSSEVTTVTIPGPLRSFLRMAAISQQASPEEVMPLLARNIFLLGYDGEGHRLRAKEYLILLRRYMEQARELAVLAGPKGIIEVSGCPDAKQLLQVIGYRVRGDCGKSSALLQTADPRRAFLTIDSGFPLPALERTLEGGGRFAYAFPSSHLPLLLTERDWLAVSTDTQTDADFLDILLHDPFLARFYFGWSRLAPETQEALKRSPGLKELVPLAPSLNFYGSYIRIQAGRVVVPGGRSADSQWEELAGASPDSPGDFVPRLLAKDDGWLAAYYDSLARVSPTEQAQFTKARRLRRFYKALEGKGKLWSATGSVFRPDPELLLLMSRTQWDSDGEPHVPGDLQVWRRILNSSGKSDRTAREAMSATNGKGAEGLLEALFALSRLPVDQAPCHAYLMMSEVDRRRPVGRSLSPQTVELMADRFSELGDQYLVFSEFPALSDASIALFIKMAEALDRISDHALRGNAMGIFEAQAGLWQILARQSEIPESSQDNSWQETIRPFAQVSSSAQLLDAGRKSVGELLRAATGKPGGSEDELIDLLAGPRQSTPAGQQMHAEVAAKMQAVMDDQRLVSLDTLSALGDGLSAMAHGEPGGDKLVALAQELREFQMPRPMFSRTERVEWTAGTYNNSHAELEVRTDIAKVIRSSPSGQELEQARGQLAAFFRDTLVGLNYAYYEPPGAQALHNNSLLVRSHDFAGETVEGVEKRLWQTPLLLGEGSPAGGGAHFVGSLADLPYVLGELEQDFISPENVQALIWRDLVPGLLMNAVLPRWWDVTQDELHAVALYQRTGEELVTAAAANEELRDRVTDILSLRLSPRRISLLEASLKGGRVPNIDAELTPADLFYLTADFRRRYPEESNSWGPAGKELDSLSRQHPEELSWERLSHDFGIPHPVIARTYARELLNMQLFPLFAGYSSRLLAETWDSTNLYWARLADEKGYPPVALNALVPTLTRAMVAKIFASDLDDWPAILRAMRETGEEFRQGRLPLVPANASAAGH